MLGVRDANRGAAAVHNPWLMHTGIAFWVALGPVPELKRARAEGRELTPGRGEQSWEQVSELAGVNCELVTGRRTIVNTYREV